MGILLLVQGICPRQAITQRSPAAAGAGQEPPPAEGSLRLYPWPRRGRRYDPLSGRFPAPAGFQRVEARPGSFAHFLRHLPLLPPGTPVRSYLGRVILPADHAALAAVVDLDLSQRDRQQCADTIMRLWGEYLHAVGRAEHARFRWAGGLRFGYDKWRRGLRPVKVGRRWEVRRKASPSRGYRDFRRYLEFIFSWTGTLHLAGERKVRAADLQPGDFFIQGGSPGHAVMVLDLAQDDRGRLRALLGQGFMPAQDMHVLRAPDGEGWFTLDPASPTVQTPLWRPFGWGDLRRIGP